MMQFIISDVECLDNAEYIYIEKSNKKNFFEYKDREAHFSYKKKNKKVLINQLNKLFFQYDKNKKLFLCASFSNNSGRLYLSNDYNKVALFNKETESFIGEELDTEKLDCYLERIPIDLPIKNSNVVLCINDNYINTDSIRAKIIQTINPLYRNSEIMEKYVFDAFKSSLKRNGDLCFMYDKNYY